MLEKEGRGVTMAKRSAEKSAAQTPPEKRTRTTRQSSRIKKTAGKEEKEVVYSRQVVAVAAEKSKSKGKKDVIPRDRGAEVVAVQSTSDSESNVIYIGHVPHGFFENQMRDYFTQFGDVTKVKVSRSKTTGKSKGFAFVEFESHEVAKIVAETMHDYLMFGQKLVCKLVPLEELHPHTFKGTNQRFKQIPWRKIESERHNKERTKGQEAKRKSKLAHKDERRQQKIKDAGIDYEFDGYASKPTSKKNKSSAKKKLAVKKTAIKKTPAKKTPAKKAPAKKAAVKETPARKTPARKAAVKETPVRKTPARKAAVKETPAKKTLPKISPRRTRSKTRAQAK